MPARTAAGRLTMVENAGSLPAPWSRIAQGRGLSLDLRFLRSVEPCDVHVSRRYLVYETPSGEAVIAVAELLLPPAIRNPVTSILFGRLGARLPAARDWQLPMLMLRAEFGGDVPYITHCPTVADRAALLQAMIAELALLADRESWSLAVIDVPDDDRAMGAALAARGFVHTLARPHASLQVEWDSWQAYLAGAARRSKNAAQNIRREVNRARRDDVTIVEWDPAQVPESELQRLMAEHEERLNRRTWRFKPGFIGRLAQALDGDLNVLLAQGPNGLQGAVLFAVCGDRGYLMYPGLVDKGERAVSAYFSLAYYRPIQLAIERGLGSVAYGNGAFEAKIRRGCMVRAHRLYFRPRRRLLRLALRAPCAWHRRGLLGKYAPILRAPPFSFLGS